MTVFDGPGVFVWQVKRCAGGFEPNTEEAWVSLMNTLIENNMCWAAIKVCDGVSRYNLRKVSDSIWEDDILPGLFDLMDEYGFPKIGWQYIYGGNPLKEAQMAADRIMEFDLDGFIMDPEAEYKQYDEAHADIYMTELKRLVPNVPLALCTYRFPKWHMDFPWMGFLNKMGGGKDVHMPQVYWEGDFREDGPGLQLDSSIEQLKALKDLPVVPVGAAYGHAISSELYWAPTPEQIKNFSEAVRAYALHNACVGMSWWELGEMFEKDSNGERGWFKAIATESDKWRIDMNWSGCAKGFYCEDKNNIVSKEQVEEQDFVIAKVGEKFHDTVQACYDADIPIILFFPNDPELYLSMGGSVDKWPDADRDPQIAEIDKYIMCGDTKRAIHGIMLDCSKLLQSDGKTKLTPWWISKHGEHMLDMIWKQYRLPVYLYMDHNPIKEYPQDQGLINFIDNNISTVDLTGNGLDEYPADNWMPTLPFEGEDTYWSFVIYDVALDGTLDTLFNGAVETLYDELNFYPTEDENEKPIEEPEELMPTGKVEYEIKLYDDSIHHVVGNRFEVAENDSVSVYSGTRIVFFAPHVTYLKEVK